MEMGPFYHHTSSRNVDAILRDGLRCGAEIGTSNRYFGSYGDPSYIYLWGTTIIPRIAMMVTLGINPKITVRTTSLLEIDIDDDVVERDYDQLLYLLREFENGNEQALKQMEYVAIQLGISLNDTSLQGIKRSIDALPEEKWARTCGAYRIRQFEGSVRPAQWKTFVPRCVQIIGYMSRPAFRLASILKHPT